MNYVSRQQIRRLQAPNFILVACPDGMPNLIIGNWVRMRRYSICLPFVMKKTRCRCLAQHPHLVGFSIVEFISQATCREPSILWHSVPLVPRQESSVIPFSGRLCEGVVVQKVRQMQQQKDAQYTLGGFGWYGQRMSNPACQSPFNIPSGLKVPNGSAKSAIVMTRR